MPCPQQLGKLHRHLRDAQAAFTCCARNRFQLQGRRKEDNRALLIVKSKKPRDAFPGLSTNKRSIGNATILFQWPEFPESRPARRAAGALPCLSARANSTA